MNGKHQIAIWAGAAAFFGSLLTIGVVDFLTPDKLFKLVSALIIAVITGAAVYSKQRLDDAKSEKKKDY